jgi:hypothetical protein
MTVRGNIAGLCAAAALSLALTSPALGAPAGDEYLPKLPQSGAHSSGGSSGAATGTTTLPTGETSSRSTSDQKKDESRGKDKSDQVAPIGSSGSGGSDGGDSSGSILLNPIVLLMIVAVIAAAVGMTLRRRNADEDAESGGKGPSGSDPGAGRKSGPRTPDGEIVTGRDRIA